MTKPFLFVNTTVTVGDGTPVNSWELINIGDSTLMHAAWNPEQSLLVCQFNSIKESIIPYPVMKKNGKTPEMQERRVDQYYRITIGDKDAIKYLLTELCANYTNQEWDIKHISHPKEVLMQADSEQL